MLFGVSCLDAQLFFWLWVVGMVECSSSGGDSFSCVFFGASHLRCPVGFLFGGGSNGVVLFDLWRSSSLVSLGWSQNAGEAV